MKERRGTRMAVMATVLMSLLAVAVAAGEAPRMKMTTEIPESITMPDKIETRIGTLELFDGFPNDETVEKAYDFLAFQRGVDVFLDEMRAASMVALRNGHRELGITEAHQVAIFEDLMDSKALWLTPNSETVYASTFMDLKANGPMIIESPPNVLGILDDMWMRYVGDIGNAGPDKGKGGKFIILPPGFEDPVPDGYHAFYSKTYGVWFLLRGFLIDGRTGPAVASFKEHMKIYPLSKAGNPPAMVFKNVSGKVHNTIHANNMEFFDELDSLIQEEHDDAISPEARGRLAMLGIIKGRAFEPDDRMRKTLDEAARVGAVIARSVSFASRDKATYIYPDDHTWFNPFSIGNHEFMAKGGWVNLDARVQFMYNAIGITPAMAIAMPGIGSQYAAACRDADGAYLDGSKTYKLRLPPNVPAKDFWSVVLYDSQTRSMLQTDQRFPSLNSQRGSVEQNAEGSFDIYFGPKAPSGKENNWIQTIPGKAFWLLFRLYGPLDPWFDKTWRPGKIELLAENPGKGTATSAPAVGERVTVANFVRAESDHMIRANMKAFGVDFGQFAHLRKPTTPDNQPVIRMNQDTLYSGTVLDLSKPVKITLPEVGGRYMSMHAVSQDHYMLVESKPGTYELAEDSVGTRFALVTVRTFYNAGDPDDLAKAHAAQDKIEISGGGDGPFETPNWDMGQLSVARKALSDLAVLGFDTTYAFGSKQDVRPIDHLVGAAAGWGGLPRTAAFYVMSSVDKNDGKTPHAVTVKDVPVDAFWSITVYNADGYLEANDLGRNSYNNYSAKPNEDGSYTIHFGGNPKSLNYLPITEGWNYAIRMYQPRKEILDGEWAFPSIEPVK